MGTTHATTPCVFCRVLKGELTPGVIAFRDSETAVFPSRAQQPRNLGHMLVVPIQHIAHLYEIGDDLAGPLMSTLARVAAAVKRASNADGVSVRQNNEPHAGQDVFHLHFHVVPRFADDGFVGLGADIIDVPLDQRIAQAKKLSEFLGRPMAGSSCR